MKYDFILVVLTYKNIADLEDFFNFFKLPRTKVIVVNSFYDDESDCEFRKIAECNNADFISIPNKGYGFGNNCGCKYALTHYDFKYLVVSNADINILRMNVNDLRKYPDGIYAPSIHTLSGKQQNPHMPYHLKSVDNVKYMLFLKNNWKGIMMFCALNKIFRLFFLIIGRFFCNKVYSAHGAFVIVPEKEARILYPFYDEDVFLFTEEEHLAMKAKEAGIGTYFVPEIQIKHKEDGSVSAVPLCQRDITRKSYITFWNKWYNQ